MELNKLEPVPVWKHFFEICAIPRPSRHEEKAARWVLAWARARGLEGKIDEANNVIIKKPASPGREGTKGIILQAHLDMVGQAASGSTHDFSRDPIRPRIDPDTPAWLVATGTTLGADNGIGIALALAILEDDALEHGPLECLFTTNEEDGMSGARALKAGALEGRVLLNIDGEDDAELTIGCAGSIRTASELSRKADVTPAGFTWLAVSIGGLRGGHSGVDIDKGRASAPLALARVLSRSGGPIRIVAIAGGTASNAIPRDARASIGIPSGRLDSFQAAFARESAAIKAELGDADPGFTASIAPLDGPMPAAALGEAESGELLSLLSSMPNGLVAMEPDMPDLVRTSLNLGKLTSGIDGGRFLLSTLTMVRSSSDEEKERVARNVEAHLGQAARKGWLVSTTRPAVSPAWTPEPASPLLATAKTVYHGLFQKPPRVVSTHGGLECGLFRPIFPNWEMISFGPTILCAHSPDERLEIASVARSYRFLRELVARVG